MNRTPTGTAARRAGRDIPASDARAGSQVDVVVAIVVDVDSSVDWGAELRRRQGRRPRVSIDVVVVIAVGSGAEAESDIDSDPDYNFDVPWDRSLSLGLIAQHDLWSKDRARWQGARTERSWPQEPGPGAPQEQKGGGRISPLSLRSSTGRGAVGRATTGRGWSLQPPGPAGSVDHWSSRS